MATCLLDANVIIALTDAGHEHFDAVTHWMRSCASFATCPITEGSLIRHHLRRGSSTHQALRLVDAIHRRAGHEFWPDALSYTDVDLNRVIGHRQVTDAYLAALARAHAPARLVTLDQGLAAAHPDVTDLVAA